MENYASAPYNFIPFPKSVVYRHFIEGCIENEDKTKLKAKGINELVYHDKFYSNLKTGYIDYKITTESPMFIGDGKGNFFKVNNECTIPGSTMRGRVRSNAEVLSCAYPEFINDKKMWYRAPFSNGKDVLKILYNNTLFSKPKNPKITDKVKAGYLTNKNGKYTIIPAVEDEKGRSFRDINEGELRKRFKKSGVNDRLVNYMYRLDRRSDLWDEVLNLKFEKKRLKTELKEKIESKVKEEITKEEKCLEKAIQSKIDNIADNIAKLLQNNEVKKYEPYYRTIDYEINVKNNQLNIKYIKEFNYNKKYGVLMNSSKVNGSNKQNHYIIYKPDEVKRKLPINHSLKVSFDTSIKYIKNVSKKFHLPDNNECIPVFYVLDKKNEEVQSFGFTPYLKVAYGGSVSDGVKVNQEYKGKCIDYIQGIFGFANFKSTKGEISYKGRVKFTNAKLKQNKGEMDKIFKSLMNPKINSFQIYLKQDKNDIRSLNTYEKDFELRGEKFYWMHDNVNIVDDFKTQLEKVRSDNSRYNTHKREPQEYQFAKLKSINSKSEFIGRIYFENLDYDELGLLLMALNPYDKAVDNIGQGKPYGFGKIKVDIVAVKELKMSNRFTKLNCSACEEDIDIEGCKQAFENNMEKNLGCDLKDTDIYKYFCLSKNDKQIPKDSELKYMELGDFKERKALRPIEGYLKQYEEREKLAEMPAVDLEDERFREYVASKFESNDRIKISKGRK
ncbi:TIGR03986 family type III CRISPR-associated RAMP protein [Clostridium felsineum]|uniref:TIGR03986 family type III CRISPR-associated RAMP protein n=1 Tax=Clostridium felsineum TaxID=36839 RepID=UPI00098CD503|nr:TIGR03986 family CRISPR-associated RAMP protein [Clostridium felsineum]URZ15117.1 hypothetical protein CLFE_011350 [Clostridium felsineum DSM 794]